MLGFPSRIDLTNLTADQGFIVQGDEAGDYAGFSVSSAGDVNGDGIDDFIVGAILNDDGGANAGAAYVVFGTRAGFGTDVDGRQMLGLASLSAAQGFVIQGDAEGDQAGYSVSSAGDVNGDGIDDLIVGARYGSDGHYHAGAAYVIFGTHGTFGTDVGGRQVIDLASLTPTQGFVIQGAAANDLTGQSVSAAGDVNGDGIDDLIVGAVLGDDGGDAAGQAYVIFGTSAGFGSVDGAGRQALDLSSLTSSQGFIIQGDTLGDRSGQSVSAAGDVNGDNIDDLIVGAFDGDDGGYNAGEAYVVFGTRDGFGTADGAGRQVIDLTSLTAAQGFIIQGGAPSEYAGFSVSSAGDVNGDGIDDLIVGAPGGDDGAYNAGQAYVVFGTRGGFGIADGAGRQVIDLASLAAAQGFIIQGVAEVDRAGRSVSSAGDVNGDGIDDLIVGALGGDDGDYNAGQAYVVFGTRGGFGTDVGGRQVLDLATLTDAQGFIIQGDAAGDYAGFSVSAAGDVDGDGIDDLIVGAYRGDGGGTDAGAAYVIFGRAPALPGVLAINDVTLAEGNSGTTQFAFTVNRSGGSGGAVGATWTITFTGGANAADLAAAQALTGTVSFADGETSRQIVVNVQGDLLIEPDESFTVTLSVPIGGATISDGTGIGTIVNDDFAAPTVDLDGTAGGTGYSGSFAENSAGAPIGNAIAVTAPSLPITGATIAITDAIAGDGLIVAGTLPATITVVSGSGTSTLVLGGAGSTADWAAALSLVRYRTASDNPDQFGTDTARSIAVTVSDGARTSAPATAAIAIVAADDAPTVTNFNGDSVTFTEGDSYVLLDQMAPAAITDPDNQNFAGGSFSIGVLVNPSVEDELYILNLGPVGTVGNNVYVESTLIGTITSQGPGQLLTISFNGDATPALVAELIDFIAYRNNGGDDPTAGSRSIAYVLNDGAGGATAGSVTVNVVAVDDPLAAPPTNSVTTNEDVPSSPVTIGATDPDDTLSYRVDPSHQPAHGTVSFDQANATFTYTPGHDQNGPDSFVIDISDGHGGVVQQTVNVAIVPVNDDPVANSDTLTASEDTPVTYVAADLTGNDTDVEGDALSIVSVSNATGGTAVRNGDGTVTFTPTHDFNGTAGFDYVVSDGNGGTDTGHATVNVAAVNDAPTADATSGSGAEDGDRIAVTLSATDPDPGDSIDHFNLASLPAHGALYLSDSGGIALTLSDAIAASGGGATVYFQPDHDWNGDTSFTYTASDGEADSAPATADIIVDPVNDDPVLGSLDGDVATYSEGDAYALLDVSPFATVSDIDSLDFDGGRLTLSFGASGLSQDRFIIRGGARVTTTPGAVIVDNVTIGSPNGGGPGENLTIDFNANATPELIGVLLHALAYTNTAGDTPTAGTRDISVTLTDGDGGSTNVASHVQVTAVNDAPVANSDTLAATEDTPVTYAAAALVGNDTDVEGDALAVASVSNATGGTAVRNANGSVTFTPTHDFNGTAGFDYVVGDGNGGTATGHATVNVAAVNDAPTVAITPSGGTFQTNEQVALDLKGSIAVGDTDAGGGQISATLSVGYGILTVAAGSSGALVSNSGTATVTITGTLAQIQDLLGANATSVVTYTPNTDTPPTSTLLTVSVNDGGNGGSSGAQSGSDSETIAITPVNDAPVNTTTPVTASEDAVAVPVSGYSISDPDADPAVDTMTVTLAVVHGTLSVATGVANGVSAGQVGGNGTASVTLTGTQNQINATLAASSGLTYTPTHDYHGPDEVIMTTSDLGHNGSGGVQTDVDHAAIQVAASEPPTSTGLSGDVATWTEGGPAVLLDVLSDAAIADIDSADFDMGGLTVAIAGAFAEDGLFIGATGGVTTGAGTVSVGGTQIGTFTGGGYGGRPLVFTFDEDATPARVAALIHAISYNNDGGNDPTEGTRTIIWTLTDGDANGLALVVNSQVDVVDINDEPLLSAVAANPIYVEDAAAADLYGTVTAGTETGQTFTALTLTVGNVTDGASEIIVIDGASVALTDGNSALTTSGLTVHVGLVGTIATVSFSGASLGTAALQALVDGLAYRNSSQNPTDGDRVVTITQLVDSGSNANPNDNVTTLAIASTVNVNPVNDAAIVTGTAGGDVTEAGGVNNGTPGTPTATGDLDASDVDNPADLWQPVAGAASANHYGNCTLSAAGVWTFTLDDDNAAVQALNGAATLTDTFTALTADGTARTVTITIHAQNDIAVARPDAFTTTESAAILAASVFADHGAGADVDPDNMLVVSAVNGSSADVGHQIMLGSGALLTLNADGTFDYDPNHAFDSTPAPGSGASNMPGHDQFSYTVAGGNTVTVAITVTGLDTNDTLLGTAGLDVLAGGNGNDIYLIDNGGDQVIEAAGAGFDIIYSTVSYTLAAGSEIEILSVTDHGATSAINFTGNGFANYLYGNAGANVLNGGGGVDVMLGFGGNDTFYVDNAGDYVGENVGGGIDTIYASVSYALDPNSEIEILSVTDQNTTTAIAFSGNHFANTLYGNAGANVLYGGGGEDMMFGFGGNDSYYVDSAGDYVGENAGGGTDIIYASVSYVLQAGNEIEILSVTDHSLTTAIDFTGNEFANYLYGNAGNNVLNGGAGGGDVMLGFGGNDTFYVDSAGDYVGETVGGGSDTIYASVSYALDPNSEIEILSVTNHSLTTAIDFSGNQFANNLYGNAGANILFGGGGADVMLGFGGNDTFYVDNAGDYVGENAGGGFDVVYASVSYVLAAGSEVEILSVNNYNATTAINLTGSTTANSLYGNAGANILDGGVGADLLAGFGGADKYAFTTALGGGNVDTILGFGGVGTDGDDLILLDHAVFTGLGLGALNSDAFFAGAAAHDADDRIIYDPTTGALYFDADGNGSGAALQFAILSDSPSLTAGDFSVI